MNSQPSTTARLTAFSLAAITATGLIIRVVLAAEQYGSVLSGLSHLYQFFTIFTNTLVLCVMGCIAAGKSIHRVIIHATVVSIIGVGIIFHALLSHTGAQEGLDWIANHLTHSVVPILSFGWWLAHTDMRLTRWRDSFSSLIWPGLYCAYALIRAEFSNFYPYPFIDLAMLGWGGLIKSVCNLSLAFLVLALITIAYARIFSALKYKLHG